MSVEIYLPPSMQNLAGGIKRLLVEGATVGDCLDQIIQKYPQLKEAIFGLNQGLSKRLSIYINTENAHPEGLRKAVRDGDKLYIMDILVGG